MAQEFDAAVALVNARLPDAQYGTRESGVRDGLNKTDNGPANTNNDRNKTNNDPNKTNDNPDMARARDLVSLYHSLRTDAAQAKLADQLEEMKERVRQAVDNIT